MAKNVNTPAATSKAAPGTAGDTKAKKAKTKVTRAPFLAEGDAKLTSADERLAKFDPKVHRKLRPSDFTGKPEAMRFRAITMEANAKKLRADADQFEKLGGIADNKKAKRLLALTNQIEALKASLSDDGQDVSELLKSMGIG